MWDESLIETKAPRSDRKRWFGFPFAAALHAAVIVVLAVASYWKIEAMELPAHEKLSAFMVESLPAGPPPARGVQRIRREERRQPKQSQTVNTIRPVVVQKIVPEENTNVQMPESETGNLEESITGNFGREDGVEGGNEFPVGSGSGFGEGEGEFNEAPKEYQSYMEEPVLLRRVDPEYPETARRARIQGIVVLKAVINKEGKVEDVTLLRPVHPLLDQSAIRAVLQWKYRPAYFNGKPLRVYFTVTVNYKLK